jgi:hypothetical protein
MVLYKYYGYKAGLAALRSRKLGFRCPNDFNDPLELSFPGDKSDSTGQPLTQALEVLRKWVVILSLTETPMDPLMWAHYGEEHKGFVIGYDISDPFLNSSDYNLITADDGTVTYASPTVSEITATYDPPPIHSLLQFGLGAPPNEKILNEVLSLAKKVFLTKHPRWSSEREVRVIKLLTSAFETASDYQTDPLRGFSRPSRLAAPGIACSLIPGLYLYDHQMRIEEVYLGARNPLIRNPLIEGGNSDGMQVDRTLVESSAAQGWTVRGIRTSAFSWELEAVDLGHASLLIAQRRLGLTHCSSFDANMARFLRDNLASHSIDNRDQFEITTWNGMSYLKKNDEFI